jgi:Spy/CpxP family protein refolding chaperone
VNEGKLQERMRLYVQNRLSLSKAEAERFTPVFIRYFREVAQTHRENKGDRLVFQQKVIELRLRYRSEFRQIMDEQRANKVYKYEDDFRREVIQIIRENQADRIKTRRNNKAVMPY